MSPFVKLLLGVLAVVVAAGAGVVVVGLLLPADHRAQRSARLRRPPRAVWDVISDVDNFASWRTDLERVERLPDVGGQKRWREHSRSGAVTYAMVLSQPTSRMATKIADPKLPFGGTWTYVLEATPDGCTLTIVEDGEIKNPLFRFMARFIIGHTATLDAYFAALEKKLGGLMG